MPNVIVEIKSCKECKHFNATNQFSTDGWDSLEDWMCNHPTVGEKKIQGGVEWHEEKKISIPEWCPILVP